MILCRYFDHYVLDTLSKCRLKVVYHRRFNDPFENSPAIDGNNIDYKDLKRHLKNRKNRDHIYNSWRAKNLIRNKHEFKQRLRSIDVRKLHEQIKTAEHSNTLRDILKKEDEKFSSICRVLCFSDPNTTKSHEEILMWSHYSGGHTGARLWLDTDQFGLRSAGPSEVLYREERVKVNLSKLATLDDENMQNYGRALLVKSSGWAYEQEYRWLIHKQECFSNICDGKTVDFIELQPRAVVGVDVGARASAEFREAIQKCLAKPVFSHVILRVATLDKMQFQLNYEQL